MKLLIVEGTDRVGKDSLIKDIENNLNTAVYKSHWGYPTGNTDEEKAAWQKESFVHEMEIWNTIKSQVGSNQNPDTTVIWNRSHLGEYVYGNLYRKSYPDTWVPQLEETYLADDNVYLILLYADAEFITKHDDGNSYSNKLEHKKQETEMFLKAFQESKIGNKLLIKVNEGNEYLPQVIITQRVLTFFNQI